MNEKDIAELESWIKKVSNLFYDKVYVHPWLKEVFQVPQAHIVSQQVDFILGVLGGPNRYSGRNPGDAHTHIFINEEMWSIREKLLVDSFDEIGCPAEIKEKWLKVENAFKRSIVLSRPEQCHGRYKNEEIIYIIKPKAS
jgi:hemoglobin